MSRTLTKTDKQILKSKDIASVSRKDIETKMRKPMEAEKCNHLLGYYGEKFSGSPMFVSLDDPVYEKRMIDIHFKYCPTCGEQLT